MSRPAQPSPARPPGNLDLVEMSLLLEHRLLGSLGRHSWSMVGGGGGGCIIMAHRGSLTVFLGVVVFLQRLLQLSRHLLEEGDLLLQVVLHLGLEVTHADLVEVLDLGQCGARDDVAALVDALRLRPVHLALLHVLLALLHLRQGSCSGETDTK